MPTFPNETSDYREARDALLRDELDLRRRIADVADRRRRLPLGGEIPEDYAFTEWDSARGTDTTTRLSELFADGHDSLFVYQFMFRPGASGDPLEVPCPVCTSIIDGIDGIVRHVTQRASLAVIAKAPVARFAAHARSRGWRNLRLLSSVGTTFNADYHAEGDGEEQFAMATVFTRRDGRIHHFWSSELWSSRPNRSSTSATSNSCGRCGRSSTACRRVATPTGCRRSTTAEEATPRVARA